MGLKRVLTCLLDSEALQVTSCLGKEQQEKGRRWRCRAVPAVSEPRGQALPSYISTDIESQNATTLQCKQRPCPEGAGFDSGFDRIKHLAIQTNCASHEGKPVFECAQPSQSCIPSNAKERQPHSCREGNALSKAMNCQVVWQRGYAIIAEFSEDILPWGTITVSCKLYIA